MGKKTKKLASVLMSVSTIGWIAGTSAFVPMIAAADTTADTIALLQAQIATLQAQLLALAGATSGGSSAQCSFTRDITLGSRGDDVICLQNYLTSTGHFTYAGGSTGYYGSITKLALAAWQAANGVAPAAGYFGPISRAKYSMVASGTVVVPTPGTVVPGPIATSGALTVSAGVHPSASLFPENAARVPFTVVRFTAPSNGDVTINSIVVERTGLAQDAALDGVVLLDENGTQLGLSKTLNSSHQANLNDPVIVKAGMTRTLTVGANAPADLDAKAGQVAYLSVVSVSASLPVAGVLPITGAGHTVNASLTIGTISAMARGATDPGAAATKRLDTTDYTFSAVRVTAGSAEKMYMKSIRWNQIGSAGASDLANVKTYVEGTGYDTVVSSDGKYYTAIFSDNGGKGILIDKGFSKEVSVKGDIVGGTSRTVAFDLAKRTDINVVGETYGYGVVAPQTGLVAAPQVAAFTSSEDPWYDGATVTVGVGTLLVTASNKAPAQNIAINLANQPLGAFEVTVKGEPITVSRIAFNITLTSEDGDSDVDDITNIVLTNESGSVVAGPSDGVAADSTVYTTGSGDGYVLFNDTITFPVGTGVYYLKGKIGTQIDANNTQVQASTTPSTDFAGTVRGTVSGTAVTPDPTSAITLSQMTVKSGSLTISVSSVPIAQTAISGSKKFHFANFVLDAGSSGEDVRLVALPVEYNLPSSSSALSNCELYDGATVISSSATNPTGAASSTSMTFSGNGLTIPKGTAKTIGLKCDISTSASGNARVGYNTASDPSPTGVTSGQTIGEVESGNVSSGDTAGGQRMTFATGGTLTVTIDSSAPAYKMVLAGATGVELNRIKFSATNEDIDLRQLALQLRGLASNTPTDLVGRKVTLWDGATQIGEAIFSVGDFATSSAITGVTVPRDGAKVITIKGDIAAVTASGPLTNSGDLLIVEYDGDNPGNDGVGNATDGDYGVGVASGSNIIPTGGDTAAAGVRVMKAYPELAHILLTSTQRALQGGTNNDKTLYRFSVKAVGGDIALYKTTFEVSTSTGGAGAGATSSLYSLYAYTDSGFSTLDTVFNSDGLINEGQCYSNGTLGVNNTVGLGGANSPVEIYPTRSSCGATTTYIVPSGVTRYFDFRATVTGVEALSGITESFTVKLSGDSAWPLVHQTGGSSADQEMGMAGLPGTTGVESDTNDDFIWSPVSTTTSSTPRDLDFTNGYQVVGLPATGMSEESFTSN